MIKVVIDTNVLVSSVIKSGGYPDTIMNSVSNKDLHLYYSREIMDEYIRVLAYDKLSISTETQHKIINSIEELGTLIDPPTSNVSFIDESDRIFYDTAKECEATLVTGNTRHFPSDPLVMSPMDFINDINKACSK